MSESAATSDEEYDVLVLPVRIKAQTEAEARSKFLELLKENERRIRVQLAPLDIYVEGNDGLV